MASTSDASSNTPGMTSRSKVSSACDSCKRRKVRCTGKQPCEKCISAGVACTYGSASSRVSRLTTAVSYTRHLEEKVAELQALLRQQPRSQSDDSSSPGDRFVDTLTGPEDDYVFSPSGSASFHGRFAGLSVLRTVRDLCTVVAGNGSHTSAGVSGKALAEAFDCNMLDLPVYDRLASFALLPSRERVRETITIALDCALNCRECLDREKFDRQITALYERGSDDLSPSETRFLGLVYALMAIGRRHETDDDEEDEDEVEQGSQMVMLKGLTYYRAARSILDTNDAHDLNSIRSLIVMASYLMSSSMISKAYTCLCAAISASLRLGLHVASPATQDVFSTEELTERRQVFGVLNILDTYVSSALGMPNILRDADPTQVIPAPEGEMHDLGKSFVARNPFSPVSETILCAKLFQVQAQIVQDHFPTSRYYNLGAQGKHEMDHSRIAELESQLQIWHRELPEMSPGDHRALRSQLMLRFAHTAVQISLYRPFLHHIIRDKQDPDFSYKGYAFASACIQASMQAIWLIDSLDQHGYLHEAQWFIIYNLALAASCLHLFVLGTKQGPTIEESRAAALKAQELLGKLKRRNGSARRCYESLKSLADSSAAQGAQQLEEGALSPRTRFMIGIGVGAEGVF